MLISKRQFGIQNGFDSQTVEVYITEGLIQELHFEGRGRTKVETDDIHLVEGEHYVTCPVCQKKFIELGVHPQHCVQPYGVEVYKSEHPNTLTQSVLAHKRRARSEALREHQSKTLIARFKTPEGAVTRAQIAKRAQEVMDAGYKVQAAAHLRKLAADPAHRIIMRKLSQDRWDNDVGYRAKHAKWIAENIDSVHASIAHATTFLTKKSTKLHMLMHDALVAVGVQDLQTEYQCHWYSIDEALPELRIAIEVDGCYWHGCTVCNLPGYEPTRNVDKRKTTFLRNGGWTLIRIPEHEIKADIQRCALDVKALIDEIKEQKNANL